MPPGAIPPWMCLIRRISHTQVFAIYRQTRRVTVLGERVLLSAKEFELLAKLASAPHRVFSKEELLREVWGFRSLGRTRTVDSHASRLRRKLARPGAGQSSRRRKVIARN